MTNLFTGIPVSLPREWSETLVETDALRIERIVSLGHATPGGHWLDQERDEWVALLRGRAGLRFADEDRVQTLGPGDWVLIPAHRRHRVEWTDPVDRTVWLAVHWRRPA